MIKKGIKWSVLAFILYLLIGVLGEIFTTIVDDYNLFKAERATVHGIAIKKKNNLIRPPTYSVKVDVNQKESEDVFDGVMNLVTTKQMKQLEKSGTVEGYMMNNNYFNHHLFTWRGSHRKKGRRKSIKKEKERKNKKKFNVWK